LGTILDDESFANPNDSQEWAAGVTAHTSIYAGGRRTAQIRKANYLNSRATELRRQVAQFVSHEVTDAFLEFQQALDQWQIAEDGVSATIQSLDSLIRLHDLNEIEEANYYEDHLTTRLLWATANVRYNQARFAYAVAIAKLKFVTACDDLPFSNNAASARPVVDFVDDRRRQAPSPKRL
jgi:outer membrane protein TolC